MVGAEPLQGENDWSGYSYEQYVQDFGKQGSASEERAAIFRKNLHAILEHNSNSDKTWHAGPNEFTDWTNPEFRALRTGLRSDLQALRPGSSKDVLESAKIPETLDWREQKTSKGGQVVTPPKNQGGCGSCWAFSATETFESHYAIATGEDAPILSPQQIVSCAPNPQHCGGSGGCGGSTQPLAFNYTETAGLTTEEDYPYRGITGTCQPSKIQPIAKNSGYVELPVNNYTALITAVATKGPISISVAAGGLGVVEARQCLA
jgi:cathepsin L